MKIQNFFFQETILSGSVLTFSSHNWLAFHAYYTYSTLISMSCPFHSCQQVPSSMNQRGKMTRCSVSRWQILIWTTRSWRRRRLPSLSNSLMETTRSRLYKKVGKSCYASVTQYSHVLLHMATLGRNLETFSGPISSTYPQMSCLVGTDW